MMRTILLIAVCVLAAVANSHGRPLGDKGTATPAPGGRLFVGVLEPGCTVSKVHDTARKCKHVVEEVWPELGAFSFRVPEHANAHEEAQRAAQELKLRHVQDASTVVLQLHQAVPVPTDAKWDVRGVTGTRGITSLKAVRIAVLDTGFSGSHPDLARVARTGMSTVTGEAWNTDGVGHGTHVIGTIAANGNGRAIAGVVGETLAAGAPGATFDSIVPVKIVGNAGQGDLPSMMRGLDWVLNNRARLNIRVASMSIGCGQPVPALDALIDNMVAKGVVVVVSAGNNGQDIKMESPSAASKALVVTALSRSKAPAVYSNFAKKAGQVVASYGDEIQSTWNNGGTQLMSGTSMAAPHISALAAWCIEQGCCRTDTAAQVRARFLAVARRSAEIRDTARGRYYGPLVTKGNLCP